jgi:hypothetical protein
MQELLPIKLLTQATWLADVDAQAFQGRRYD